MLSHDFPIAPHSASLQAVLMALNDIVMPYEAFFVTSVQYLESKLILEAS